ncbi:MAG: ubiquitin-like small modifier protein 1 [Candidatus Geothermarchaeales archaeon]
MPVRVFLPSPLREYSEGLGEVELEAGTVRELIDRLRERFPGMTERIRDESGNVRRHVNIFVNSHSIKSLAGLSSTVKEGDKVHILPAISGGLG